MIWLLGGKTVDFKQKISNLRRQCTLQMSWFKMLTELIWVGTLKSNVIHLFFLHIQQAMNMNRCWSNFQYNTWIYRRICKKIWMNMHNSSEDLDCMRWIWCFCPNFIVYVPKKTLTKKRQFHASNSKLSKSKKNWSQ